MNTVIDPAIEKDAELSGRVHRANSYLDSRLGRFKDDVEARWTTTVDRPGQLELILRFTGETPAEASGAVPTEVLRPDGYSGPWLRGIVNRLFGRKLDVHLSRVRQMLRELEREEAVTGV